MDLATRITALAGSATHGSPSSMAAVTVYQDQLKVSIYLALRRPPTDWIGLYSDMTAISRFPRTLGL